jgi:hypothetical protein
MYLPNKDTGLEGVQKHQVSGLLYIGNFQAAAQEIENAFSNGSNPSIAIVCCTTTYQKDAYKDIQNKVAIAKAQNKLAHLDIGFGDLSPMAEGRIPDDALNNLFKAAYEFIDNAVKNNIPVLVHCDAGSTRSATLIVAYLMRSANLSLADAEKRVITTRGTIQDVDFRTQQVIRVNCANIDNFRQFLARCETEFCKAVSANPTPVIQSPAVQLKQESTLLELIIAPLSRDNNENSTNNRKLLATVFQLENKLDEIIKTMANQYQNKGKAYNDIWELFKSILPRESDKLETWTSLPLSEAQAKLCDMTQLFHTVLAHKDKMDLHKHSTIDLFLYKDKSTSWQSLIKNIREKAYYVLDTIYFIMRLNNCPKDEIVSYLNTQRNNPLFCLHRGNHWYEKFGVTGTVKSINALIAEQEIASLQL